MNSYYMNRAVEAIAPELLEGIPEDSIHTLKIEENGGHGGLDVYIGYAIEGRFLELRERRAVVDNGRVVTDYTVAA